MCFSGCSGRFMAGRVSGEPNRPSAVGFYVQAGPTDKFPQGRVTIGSFANVPLKVEVGSDGPYVSVDSIRLSRIAGIGRMQRILQGSDWLCWVGVRHHRSYHSPSLERPVCSFGSLPLRTFGCHR